MDTAGSDGRFTELQYEYRLIAIFEGDNKDVFAWALAGFGVVVY